MDPMAILATGKAAVETATDVVGKVVDMSEKMKDGAARREADSRKLEASILYGKWATVFEGVGVATTAAQQSMQQLRINTSKWKQRLTMQDVN